ncbi:MAG TPA: 50S ribosomal protein L23 [Methylomirabilota bacterium]|jgi:large subunit ribosomal protein L23|nr:50S ribosomal protein L23 [Methylomirabilota bacterium]
MSKDLYSVITAPLVTEKATLVSGAANQVVFRVRPDADKYAIKNAVEMLFKVKVKKVRTIQYLGKKRRVGKSVGRRPAWKKAYVTLAEGDRIDFFEGA